MPIGESVYAQFQKGKLGEKSVQLFDSIPKTIIPTMLLTKKKKSEILKETTAFMQNIDYARLRDYSTATNLKYEIISTSFYLTKDGFLCKHKKSELSTVVKELFEKECLSQVLMSNNKAILVVEFMAYTRKVPVKKAKPKTCRDMARHLWSTFTKLASDYARLDITFDLCRTYSIKETKQNRRNAVKGISTDKLDQNSTFVLTRQYIVKLVKMKWNFSNSSLIGSLKIILKVFLNIFVDHIMDKLRVVLSVRCNPNTRPSSENGSSRG